MKQLIEVLEGLLTAASISGGESAEDTNMALEVVDWSARLKAVKPRSLPVIDAQLDMACDEAIHQYGSNAHMICEAVLAVRDQLRWEGIYEDYESEPDMAVLSRNYAYSALIGKNGPLYSDKVFVAISLQGRDVYYPAHVHQAVERYWVVGGNGDWKIGQEPWFSVEPGSMIFHDSGVRHAIQTNADPMLCVALWSTHLDSEVVVVRG